MESAGNYDAWMAALDGGHVSEAAEKKQKLQSLRQRKFDSEREDRAAAQAARSPGSPELRRSMAKRRASVAPGAMLPGGGALSLSPRPSARRRASIAPGSKMAPSPPARLTGTPRGPRRQRQLNVQLFGKSARPAYDRERAQANWTKLRTLWQVHGENMAVWGRSYRNCFIEGAKFEWTTREVGKGVEWALEEEQQHAQVDALLNRRAGMLDRLSKIAAHKVSQERARIAKEKAEAAAAAKKAARIHGGGTPRGEPPKSPARDRSKSRLESSSFSRSAKLLVSAVGTPMGKSFDGAFLSSVV